MCLQITPCVPVYVAFTTTVYLTTYDLHINLTLAKSDFLTVAIPFQLVQKWVQHKTFSQKSFPIGEAPPFYGRIPLGMSIESNSMNESCPL